MSSQRIYEKKIWAAISAHFDSTSWEEWSDWSGADPVTEVQEKRFSAALEKVGRQLGNKAQGMVRFDD